MLTLAIFTISCNSTEPKTASASANDQNFSAGQSGVRDDESQKDILKVAMGSPDHTTLVKAIDVASYQDVLANPGPFTVFAPTDEAFKKLPEGTLESLMKPEAKEDLRNILQYHVYIGSISTDNMKDGQVLNQANMEDVKIGVKDGKYTVNGANIIASVPCSNGIVHIIDAVLLPPKE